MKINGSAKLFNCPSQGLHNAVDVGFIDLKDIQYTTLTMESNKILHSPSWGDFLQCVKSLTEPHNLQQLGFSLSDRG